MKKKEGYIEGSGLGGLNSRVCIIYRFKFVKKNLKTLIVFVDILAYANVITFIDVQLFSGFYTYISLGYLTLHFKGFNYILKFSNQYT
ncbi:hypothetical protein HanRHA438_Chr12g0559181 [Helianthus annuus]|nr:hypothetical protein HanRHA438_Chr12g0559181 [Helianthus annuus]